MEVIIILDLNIVNAKIFLEDDLVDASLGIDQGRIVVIGKENAIPKAQETIDASGKIVIPGGIDVHTHILDLIFDYRETFVTGTRSAAAGGITTVLEMPLGIEGKSVLEVFDMQLDIMKKRCLVDFGIIGSAGYSSIDTIAESAQRGAVAFKTFMINPSEEEAELKDLAAKDDYFLMKIFSEIAKTGLVSSVHAENDVIISNEIDKLISKGRKDFKAHTASRPAISEDEACMRALLLAHHANVKLNLVHMSSKNAFDYIRRAKQNKWDVTCEITPHHLFLTSEDGEKIGSWAKVDPPLRSRDHVIAAWEALNDRTIDMIASDHSPYSDDEKDVSQKDDNFFEVGSGTTGLETILPLMIDAVNKKKITLQRVVESTSITPSKRFGLYPRKGTIALGADADLVIVDMRKEYTLKSEELFTKPKVTVFDGMKLKGAIEKTFVRGNLVYDTGSFHVDQGYGRFLTPL
ncbi:MAG: dihydroorotase [Candidatus Heimdallarchaeota archaeon]|nr:MAG: dihydroorotase [Candidatus Heimdallarchaeota archaeon]